MSSKEHGGKGPSVAELEKYVREKVRLEFFVAGGKSYSGTLRWFDEDAFALSTKDGEPLTLLKSSVIGYKPVTT
jgi:hypothetical protein